MRCVCDEQQFLDRMNAAKAEGLPVVERAAGAKGRRLVAGVLDATKLLVTSDARFREAERLAALGLDYDRGRAARELAVFRNNACLEVLRDELRPAIADVRDEFAKGEHDVDCEAAWRFFDAEMREALVTQDLSERRAHIAGRVLANTRSVADEHGIAGLCDVLDGRVERLIALREEREQHHNPILVIAGGAIAATGFLILGICSALSTGRTCRNPVVSFIADMHILVGLSLLAMAAGSGEDNGGEEGGGIDEDTSFPEGPL